MARLIGIRPVVAISVQVSLLRESTLSLKEKRRLSFVTILANLGMSDSTEPSNYALFDWYDFFKPHDRRYVVFHSPHSVFSSNVGA
mmetsp:Transcript_31537/g.50630  ORF Transcript_31537/g.50630 Transcript_31537/m.50630 type:complete len:86 (+) Transcript_31537:509-766(+)